MNLSPCCICKKSGKELSIWYSGYAHEGCINDLRVTINPVELLLENAFKNPYHLQKAHKKIFFAVQQHLGPITLADYIKIMSPDSLEMIYKVFAQKLIETTALIEK